MITIYSSLGPCVICLYLVVRGHFFWEESDVSPVSRYIYYLGFRFIYVLYLSHSPLRKYCMSLGRVLYNVIF